MQPDTEVKPYDERIVVASQANGLYDIFHRNGNHLLQIESRSLSHALEYEKRLGICATVDAEPLRFTISPAEIGRWCPQAKDYSVQADVQESIPNVVVGALIPIAEKFENRLLGL